MSLWRFNPCSPCCSGCVVCDQPLQNPGEQSFSFYPCSGNLGKPYSATCPIWQKMSLSGIQGNFLNINQEYSMRAFCCFATDDGYVSLGSQTGIYNFRSGYLGGGYSAYLDAPSGAINDSNNVYNLSMLSSYSGIIWLRMSNDANAPQGVLFEYSLPTGQYNCCGNNTFNFFKFHPDALPIGVTMSNLPSSITVKPHFAIQNPSFCGEVGGNCPGFSGEFPVATAYQVTLPVVKGSVNNPNACFCGTFDNRTFNLALNGSADYEYLSPSYNSLCLPGFTEQVQVTILPSQTADAVLSISVGSFSGTVRYDIIASYHLSSSLLNCGSGGYDLFLGSHFTRYQDSILGMYIPGCTIFPSSIHVKPSGT